MIDNFFFFKLINDGKKPRILPSKVPALVRLAGWAFPGPSLESIYSMDPISTASIIGYVLLIRLYQNCDLGNQ